MAELLDYFISAGQERVWHPKAKPLCGLQVDDQLELGRLLNRQVGGLGTLEDPTDVEARQAISARDAGPVTDQAAKFDEIALVVDRWNSMMYRQRHKGSSLAGEEGTAADQHRLSPSPDGPREGSVQFILARCRQHHDLLPEGTSCRLHVRQRALAFGIVRIKEHGKNSALWDQFM